MHLSKYHLLCNAPRAKEDNNHVSANTRKKPFLNFTQVIQDKDLTFSQCLSKNVNKNFRLGRVSRNTGIVLPKTGQLKQHKIPANFSLMKSVYI